LTIPEWALSRNCAGLTRRDFLTGGSLGLAGLTLLNLLCGRAAAEAGRTAPDTSVVWLFLSGGPSRIDNYDLKPDAPREYRGPYKAVSTNVLGIRLFQLMPKQAMVMDKMAVVRTLSHGDGNHRSAVHWVPTGVLFPSAQFDIVRGRNRRSRPSTARWHKGPGQQSAHGQAPLPRLQAHAHQRRPRLPRPWLCAVRGQRPSAPCRPPDANVIGPAQSRIGRWLKENDIAINTTCIMHNMTPYLCSLAGLVRVGRWTEETRDGKGAKRVESLRAFGNNEVRLPRISNR
jgi:hypothetical protein